MTRWRPSIRLRLTLWNASVLALVLIAFASAGWFTLAAVLREGGDATVRESAQAIAGAVIAERRAARARGDTTRVRGEAARDALRELRTGNLEVFIADEAARVVAVSRSPMRKGSRSALTPPPITPRPPANPDTVNMPGPVRELFREQSAAGEVVLRTIRIDGEVWRAAVIRLAPGADHAEEPALHVGVLRSDDEDIAVLARVRSTLLLAVPIALLVAIVTGYAIARRSLEPMDSMAARTARISAATLDERLPVFNPHDELGRLATVINDLLGRVEAAFRQQKQFVADASHELRTPIAIVRGEADVALQLPTRDEAEYREAIGIIRDESVRLTRIVDDLFLLARTDAGGALDHREQVDVVALIVTALRSVRTIAVARGIALTSVLPAPEATDVIVNGDRTLLRRLLLNLLDNALKHTPTGGVITVSLAPTARDVALVVSDNGPGIATELRPHIFDRFVRAMQVLDTDPHAGQPVSASGAGLGLAIAQSIATAHGGQITLEDSVAGAHFCVTLPRAPA